MDKSYFLTASIFIVIILGVTIGIAIDKKINSAALSLSLFTHEQCVNQKCIVVNGSGQDQCSTDSNCLYANNPQKWCESHNVQTEMHADALTYPNGNFSCDCYYLNPNGTHSQTPCIDDHIQ